MRRTLPPQLDYAPPAPLHQRRVARLAMKAVVAVLTLIILAKLVPRAWNHAQLLYWQHKCLIATLPPDQIRYAGATEISAPEWDHFYTIFSPPGATKQAVIFLHERTSPSGHRRLVVVTTTALPNVSGLPFQQMSSHVIELGTALTAPQDVPTGGWRPAPASWVFYSGQPDPSDKSHFTIRVKTNEMQLMDGWLRDDDSVILELQRSPASMPPP